MVLSETVGVEWELVVANAGLIAVTGGLVYFTFRLVEEAKASRKEAEFTRLEMEASRLLSVRPRLAFDVNPLGGRIGVLLIRNLGRGAAFNVAISVSFGDKRREWGEASIAPGDRHELKFPPPYLQELSAVLTHPITVTVDGTMEDMDGRRLAVSQVLDVTAWWEKVTVADERVAGRLKVPHDPYPGTSGG